MTREAVRAAVRTLGGLVPVAVSTPAPRREVVLLRPDHLGDGILTLPALMYLRRQAPMLRRTVAAGPWNREFFLAFPDLAELAVIPFPGFARTRRRLSADPYRTLWREARRLRQRRPLAAVVLRDDHWWGAWLCALAGIPIRIGSDHPHVRPFLTHPVPLRSEHVAARNLELAESLLATLGLSGTCGNFAPERYPLVWPLDERARARIRELLAEHGVQPPVAIVHPGSGTPSKCWPTERWAALAEALHARGMSVVLTGSASERADLERIAALARSHVTVLAGMLSVSVLAELMREARIVVGPDTGPLHLAVAVGTATVHLFGPTDPARFGPWGPSHRHRAVRSPLTCSRCGDIGPDRGLGVGCMMALTVDRVVREIEVALVASERG
ncbi:MAG: glycosyltransferase family 9 protein [Thermomicrobium sp.]|nr:glycosyltransferase family 9 protein [Thermomicrobium sp.]